MTLMLMCTQHIKMKANLVQPSYGESYIRQCEDNQNNYTISLTTQNINTQ